MDLVDVASVTLAGLALAVSLGTYRGGLRHATRPVLVFAVDGPWRWRLHNVGSGPAVSLVVVDLDSAGTVDSATSCYPLAAGAVLDLPWLRAGAELLVEYTDVFGTTYTTRCADNRNVVRRGRASPVIVVDSDQWVQLHEGRPAARGLRARDLRGLSATELDRMRNERYARHGYVFRRADLRAWFEAQPWYQPRTRDVQEVEARMSPVDRYEAVLIRQYQRRFGLLVVPPSDPRGGVSDRPKEWRADRRTPQPLHDGPSGDGGGPTPSLRDEG